MLALAVDLSKELQQLGLPAVAIKPVLNKRTRMSIQSGKFESGQVWLPTVASWLDELEAELFAFPGGRYDDQIDSISQALAYEIFSGEWMTDAALKGYGNLIEGLCFHRLFSGGDDAPLFGGAAAVFNIRFDPHDASRLPSDLFVFFDCG